jgi:hypothetical protein
LNKLLLLLRLLHRIAVDLRVAVDNRLSLRGLHLLLSVGHVGKVGRSVKREAGLGGNES